MDIKIEPEDDTLSENYAANTYHNIYGHNNVNHVWCEGLSAENIHERCVKQEIIEEEEDFKDVKQINLLNEQNDEGCSNIKLEQDDMQWENHKDDAGIKIEQFDVAECSYAETTTVQCIDVNFEPPFAIGNPVCEDFPAARPSIACGPPNLRQENLVAIVELENCVFFKRNFVCRLCFSVFPKFGLLEGHKVLHSETVLNIEYDTSTPVESEGLKAANPTLTRRKSTTNRKKFKCSVCEYSSAHAYSLKTHTMIHTGEKPFECDQCVYKTAYSFHLKSHKMSHSSEKTMKCDQCHFTSAHYNSLKRHKIIHSGIKPFKCDQCNYKATSSFLLRKHKTSHSNEKPFKCHSCEFSCANSSNLKRHNMIHSGEKPFQCNSCDFKTIYSFHFKMHKLLHTGQKPYRCDVCDYKTIHAVYLKAHKMTHLGDETLGRDKKTGHSEDQTKLVRVKEEAGDGGVRKESNDRTAVKTEPAALQKPFECDLCSYKTAKPADLKRHAATHSGERPWRCEQCAYRSASASNLKAHRLVHGAEKPFGCDRCAFRSLRSSDLKRHSMLHTGEKPHRCDACDYRTAYRTDLKKHKLTHLKPLTKIVKCVG